MSGLVLTPSVDALVQGLVLAAQNEIDRGFTRRALRTMPVKSATGRILKVGQPTTSSGLLGRQASVTNLKIGASGGYGRLAVAFDDSSLYTLAEYALGVPYSLSAMREAAAAGQDVVQIASATGLQQIMAAEDGASWALVTGTTQIAASGNWGSSSVDPGADIDGAVRAIMTSIGQFPREFVTVSVSRQTADLALRNARYRGALTADGSQPRRLTSEEQLAAEWNVGKVVVCDTVYNAAVEGQTDSGSFFSNPGYVGVYYDPPMGSGLVRPPAFAFVEYEDGLVMRTNKIDALREEVVWQNQAQWTTVNSASGRTLTGTTA